ncbi:MBL fold metallo-hydrolase [Mucilaginibacter conchicola]|uniref:MBL fold metallo-hydrolase n=1 Tax=Mucilaginibacter conchicola TaxID=2303333 RepID=A0A372NPU4_9SPHI|nr:MBL fold metallo-hydrolase [Mucilaginibacter conchicola]RFZ90942.1 MBL fold metallo-hydrolase [Mucilaginibacter conchicola]
MQGNFAVTKVNDLTIHTYTSPENGWSVNSHIVELPTQLLLVDAQLLIPYAKEVAGYAAELGKPITWLYVTHHHPDHYFGAQVFDIKVSALHQTAEMIAATGDAYVKAMHPRLGELVPGKVHKPEIVIAPGYDVIDGVDIEFIHSTNAETADALMIAFPKHGVIITQDLIYNNIHAFLGEMAFETWRNDIKALQKSKAYDHILPGHGAPGGPELYQQMLDYLELAGNVYDQSKSFEEFVNLLTSACPNRQNQIVLKVNERYLYPKKS